ncbi:hypothetical protein B0H63DRAFT_152950 [Podospora didyma]|uniref:Uncharacterized protein n=1 Tax=Podospora didyma TaxID=330526 RepID=A0AAE0NT49_9PEZI|nr:hypothetical protein B0H63DRAFT_152950 [Podospora didyma]
MDVAYNQHSSAARRKNHSTTNLNYLTLAPLTSRLPLDDDELLNDSLSAPALAQSSSYLQGKSAPTTPRLLSRSPGSRSQFRPRLPKSKSATHIAPLATYSPTHVGSSGRQASSVSTSPVARRKNHHLSGRNDRSDSDWLLRAGALISTETRESKGQAWLVSRASSTSLVAMHDDDDEDDDEAFDREREQQLLLMAAANGSRGASRRSSLGHVDDENNHHHHYHHQSYSSPTHSRFGSRSHSRVGSRTQLHTMVTPSERRSVDGYFPPVIGDDSVVIAGPDFVNLDEKLEAIEQDTSVDDEAYVRRLVKRGNATGVGTWFGSVLGVQLFSVEEDEEGSDDEDAEGYATDGSIDEEEEGSIQEKRTSSTRRLDGLSATPDERMPPPKSDEGGWQDAAWLLTVASKVLL